MKHVTLLCCCVISLYWAGFGTIEATPLYSATLSWFSDGLEVSTGRIQHDPTILVLVCGPEEVVEAVLVPPLSDLADFPGVDLSFAFDTVTSGNMTVYPETLLNAAVVDAAYDFGTLPALAFQEFRPEQDLLMSLNDLLVVKTGASEFFSLSFLALPTLGIGINVARLSTDLRPAVPEPGTLALVGLGLLGLLSRGIRRWFRRRASCRYMNLVVIGMLCGLSSITPLVAIAQSAEYPLITVKKAGTGSGTVWVGEFACESWCPEMSVPYSDHTAIVLKVVPDAYSEFLRWEKADGKNVSAIGKLQVKPGDTVTAVFESLSGPARPEYVEYQIFVKLRPDADSAALAALQQQLGVTEREPFDFIGVELWKMTMTVADALPLLNASPAIAYSEPNYIATLAATTPNDTHFPRLWGLHNTGQSGGRSDADIDAPEAWDLATGGNQVIAVIDTGVDYRHPDLAANMWTNPGEIPGNGRDDDANGYVDDVHGYDFANNDGDPFDDRGHGTHCAGTLAGIGNNGSGVTGVNWSGRIMALKFLRADGFGSYSDAIRAIQYAARMGVRITSNSWGGSGYSQALRDAIQAAGGLFIAAAGNSNRNTDNVPNYPSGYSLENIIAVASTDRADQRSWFSNYGAHSVDLGAPGSDIYSTIPNNRYAYFSGTSMAAPHVAGAAALLWAYSPALTPAQVKSLLLGSVDPVAALQGRTVTGGRLNLFRAMQAVPTSGYASVSAGVSIAPNPVVLGENFSVNFTLKEVRGLAKTFDKVAVAVLRADDTFVYDMAMYENVTIPASGTWSRTASSSLYASRPPGTYKIEIRGNVNGEWFAFDTVDNGVNPKTFQVIQPGSNRQTITLVSDPGTAIVETGRGAAETYQPPDWSQNLRDPATNTTWIWSSYYLTYAERQYGSTRTFRETFSIPDGSTNLHGEILIGADNFYAIYLNGQLLVDKRQTGCNSPPGELWSCWGTQSHAFTPRTGSNDLRIVVVNAPFDRDASPVIANPAGVIYRADITYEKGTPVPSKPDLIVTDLRVTSYTANRIDYAYTIKNIGSAPANLDGPTGMNHDNVSVQAYLSADTIFHNSGDLAAGGTILNVSPLGLLDPGESFSGAFGASADINPATHPYLTLKVDWGGVVDESDETNNTRAVRIR